MYTFCKFYFFINDTSLHQFHIIYNIIFTILPSFIQYSCCNLLVHKIHGNNIVDFLRIIGYN